MSKLVAISNHEGMGKVLGLLKVILGSFVEREIKDAIELYCFVGYALRSYHNQWTHQEIFSSDDDYRALAVQTHIPAEGRPR